MDAMIDFAKHSTFCFLMNQIHLSGLRQISMHRLFTQNSFLAQQCDGDPQRWLRNVCVLC